MAFLSGLGIGACNPKSDPADRPNIIWITSEDNSKHYMKIFDENGVETPNIERLARHGIVFTRAFSNAPVCSAARSTLISGVYGPRIASHYHRKLELVPMPASLEMFPAYLRQAGYYTTNNSKEDYNIIKSANVWNESSREAGWRNRQEGQPFFHVQNIGTTHESGLFFTEEEMNSPDTLSDRDACFIHPYHPQTEVFKYTNARYRDKIVTMDRQVGAILGKLEEDGLMENTFVFYFGDHGGVLPGSKGYLMETGLHVPLVVYIPPRFRHLVDGEPGSETERFVSFLDFGATVLNLAGVEIPQGIDGKPFLGKNSGPEAGEGPGITFSYADRFDEKYDMVRAVRKGQYKYIRNYQPFNYDGLRNNYRYRQTGYREWLALFEKGALNEIQSAFFREKSPEWLFDLAADPYETNNIAHDPEYSVILEDMRGELNSWVRGMPDLSFYPEFFLLQNAVEDPVEFGQGRQDEIHAYADIADLMLTDFRSAEPLIRASLDSEDPWKRYWGLIVCSSFGRSAAELLPIIRQASESDPETINRVRAAEYLGITGVRDPSPIMTGSLYASRDVAEALLILNSIVLMQDGYGYPFDIDAEKLASGLKDNNVINQRLTYLGGIEK